MSRLSGTYHHGKKNAMHSAWMCSVHCIVLTGKERVGRLCRGVFPALCMLLVKCLLPAWRPDLGLGARSVSILLWNIGLH